MSLTITDHMTSTKVPHAAHQLDSRKWVVSWLPERELDRNAAITAMILAESIATSPKPDRKSLLFQGAWAEEIGVDLDEARRLVVTTPTNTTAADR